jgi:CRP-like cAMP-binding protein
MEKSILTQFIQTTLPMSPQKAAEIADYFHLRIVSKDEFLLKAGKPVLETYFLAEGWVRSYALNTEGEEVMTGIYTAPCFANDFIAFFRKQPTQEYFQTLTDCQIWYLSYDEVQHCFHTIPEFREFGRMLLLINSAMIKNRMLDMIQLTAEQRYRKLLATQPTVFQYIPLKMLASYLGITDTSLSRIRKEITKK